MPAIYRPGKDAAEGRETRVWAARDKANPDKIGALIGPGGKNIKGIQEDTGAKIDVDDDGLLPPWLIYHELVHASSKVMLRKVCAVEAEWVSPALLKLRDMHMHRLAKSGRPQEPSGSLKDGNGGTEKDAGTPLCHPPATCSATSSLTLALPMVLHRPVLLLTRATTVEVG
ncbi:MAG: hypothetical protein HC767_11045 [Akkermansiaceae bacterium]|nr:hypothetical protein [Akkermansiaceae bacterium]